MSTSRLGALVAVAAALAACGPTTVDDSIGATVPDDTIESGVIVDESAPTTTEVVAGTAADLLPEIGLDMSRLSGEISGDGDQQATIARVEAAWAAIRDEMLDTHPELVNGIEAAIGMGRTGVDTKRPADADKGFAILTDLIDTYFGDG